MTEQHPQLTSAEIACIWTAYLNDSMSKCILGFFLKNIEDQEIRTIIQYAYDLSSTHIEKLSQIYQREQLPLPIGFTNEDVNMNAPRLFTDTFMLEYIGHISRAGLFAYGGFVAMSAREDIRAYFTEGLQEVSSLYNIGAEVSLSKGLFVRAPYISYPTKTDFIDSKKYLSGLNPFTPKRPLNAVEISYLHMNTQTNIIGGSLALSFAQTSPSEDIQKWMIRGRDISKKHVEIYTKILADNDLQPPISSEVAITDSTTPTFSDKLMLFHMGLLSAVGTGNYATAAASSQRSDLILNYERLSVEIAQYAKDGADIMIQNEWLEQPPGTLDKEQLAKNKNHNS
ncbi:DUF3231 family protein [Cytobacillus purgationiresistens]|uniref:DUF3231 family protein n=1 Tax=Cytobacillus purgationiresistens TaxID=863449 RepID=A0ABU0AKC1_9BACI|nr:DUF3231 family protein [Cytobacillus purgationiresistens]MDQ0271708.1 hypothetical protein [Cytobacillus purgationiresistens]